MSVTNLRALVAALVASIVAVTGVALAAPAAVADPSGVLLVGPAEQPSALSVSAFRVAGVSFSGSQLPSGSVDLWLDTAPTGETFAVDARGTTEQRYVAFPSITTGLHTFTMRQGTAIVATTEVNVLADPRFVFGISRPWISADTLQETGLVLTVTGLASNTPVSGSIGTAADPYELKVAGESDENGMVTLTLRNAQALASLRRAGVVAAGVTTQSGEPEATFVPIHITEPVVGTSDNGSRITGSGFQPEDEVTWSATDVKGGSGTLTGSARVDASGALVFDSPFTGTADVTLTGTVGSVTVRALTLNQRVPETFTPAQVAVIDRAADAAVRLDGEAKGMLDLLAPLIRGNLTARQREELIALRDQQRDDALELLDSIRDGTAPVRPGPPTLPVIAGGLASFNGGLAEASRLKELTTASGDVGSKLDRLAPQDKGTAVEKDLNRVAKTIDELLATADAARERATILASDPTFVGSGVLPASGVVDVAIPADFRGLHHIGLIDTQSGYFTVWQPIEVSAPAAPAAVLAPSATAVRASANRQVKGARRGVKLTATVRSSVRAKGTVELVVNGKVVAVRRLDSRTGRKAFRLPSSTKAGTARVQVRYRGAAGVAPSRSKVVTIRVVR